MRDDSQIDNVRSTHTNLTQKQSCYQKERTPLQNPTVSRVIPRHSK